VPGRGSLGAVHETPEDLREFQRVLDESHARAGEHLRSIFGSDRRMSAGDVARELRGVFLLHLATVTAAGEPLLAPIDGLFYRGRLWFSLTPRAVRIRHVRARPSVSACWTRGEEACLIVHGTAREVHEGEPLHDGFLACGREVYGPRVWDFYADHRRAGLTAWIEPRRAFAMGR
jgi:hypothetical protein